MAGGGGEDAQRTLSQIKLSWYNCMTWAINLLCLTTSIYLGYVQYVCCLEMRGQFMVNFSVPPLAQHLFITGLQVEAFLGFHA